MTQEARAVSLSLGNFAELRADNATSGLRLDDNEYYVTVADFRSLIGVVNKQENKPTKERQNCLVLRIESSPATYR